MLYCHNNGLFMLRFNIFEDALIRIDNDAAFAARKFRFASRERNQTGFDSFESRVSRDWSVKRA